jgi:hypothetical protein
MGRPPKFDAVGPVDFHLGLRFDRLRAAQIKAILADENRKRFNAGDLDLLTPSALISSWIRQRLAREARRRGLLKQARSDARRSIENDALARKRKGRRSRRRLMVYDLAQITS